MGSPKKHISQSMQAIRKGFFSAPAGIWTRVTDSKGRYTWPDYTTGAPTIEAQAEYNFPRINLTLPQAPI